MGARTDQIEMHIQSTRSELGSNLRELETRVRRLTDWRAQFEQNTALILGLSFAGGVFLSTLIPGRRQGYAATSSPAMQRAKSRASEMWDNAKSALIAIAVARGRQLLDETIPGFHEQYERSERESAPRTNGRPVEPAATRL